VSLDSDTLKFDQVVGMMQAYELQMKKKERSLGKSLALKAAEVSPSVSEDQVGLIVKRFFRKMERGQRSVLNVKVLVTTSLSVLR